MCVFARVCVRAIAIDVYAVSSSATAPVSKFIHFDLFFSHRPRALVSHLADDHARRVVVASALVLYLLVLLVQKYKY